MRTLSTVSLYSLLVSLYSQSCLALPAGGVGEWGFCTQNSDCINNCCSREYSDDGQLKCTPGGKQCMATTSTLLGDWVPCQASSQCQNQCCSNQYSDDKAFKCTPGGRQCISNGQSSVTTPPASSAAPSTTTSSSSPQYWSQPSFNDGFGGSWNIAKFSFGSENHSFSKDPVGQDQVLNVLYPEGTVSPSQPKRGGMGFYAQPLSVRNSRTVIVEYQVFFPQDFDFVKGGKLPGLYGGHDNCADGSGASDCFSARIMWRQEGAGEIYAYVDRSKQQVDLCSIAPRTCNVPHIGLSLRRGNFHFQRGQWNRLRLTMTLNTFQGDSPNADGSFQLDHQGQQVIDVSGLVIASQPNVKPEGLFFSTFFGGSTSDYATPRDQRLYFKDFKMQTQ